MNSKDVIKRIAQSPAIAVDKTLDEVKAFNRQQPVRAARKYFGRLGPGLTTGASDDDPSGIATYSQAGALFGFNFLWLALYTLPFMIVAQEMCARIAQVTGRGISGALKQFYPRWLVYLTVLMLFTANTINIGADIAGMVAATKLIVATPPYWLIAVIFTLLTLFLQIGLSYATYAKYLKYLTFALLAYVAVVFFIRVDWLSVLKSTFLPSLSFSRQSIFMATAIIGTTISPYLFYWQAAQEIEEEHEAGRETLKELRGATKNEIRIMRQDVASGMIASNVVMFFIIVATGSTLFSQGIEIKTAADAAEALRPLAGDYATWLFALGVIGTGLLAIPVLAGSASYAFTEVFSLSRGLDKKLKRAYGFYGVIILAIIIGLLINFFSIDPIKALISAAVINGLIAPILLTLILLVANNRQIMGQWKNGPWSNVIGWTITAIMYLAGAATILGLV